MWDSEERAKVLKGTFAAFGKAKRKKTNPEVSFLVLVSDLL